MSSKITKHFKRMSKAKYEELRKTTDIREFRETYLNNSNDFVCNKYEINLATVYKLLTDLSITYTEEEQRHKNKIASSEKVLELYGVDNNFRREEIKRKIKETNLSKYGAENVFASEIIKEKIKQTNLSRLGVKYPTQSATVKEKVKETSLRKFRVDNVSKAVEVKERTRSTNLNKIWR